MSVYLNLKTVSLSNTPPGTAIPLPVALLVMPVVGLAFLMFLPAAGFYLVGKWLLVESARGMAALATRLHSEA